MASFNGWKREMSIVFLASSGDCSEGTEGAGKSSLYFKRSSAFIKVLPLWMELRSYQFVLN